MLDSALTRRSFVAGAAGVASAAAVAGYVGFGAWSQARADDEASSSETKTVHTTCNACPNACGFTAYVVNGRLGKLIGDENHPYAQGKLCARGYGYSQIAYSEDRLTDPLRKNEDGEFEAIGWDEALSEIGERLSAIIDSDGPEAVALVQDPRPAGAYYTQRFMNAIGSPNFYTHGAACNLSGVSGLAQVVGTGDYYSDVEASEMTMLVGRSYADEVHPGSLAEVQRAHENGSKIVVVDPRCNNMTRFADEWVPINPGTELAFVLAMANVLVQGKRYDEAYLAENSVGFEEWAEAIASYTPAWAEGVTGIDAGTIERLALEMWQAAPAASIDLGWRDALGCSYANSGETARAVACFNSLLACWNQQGGALFLPSVSAGTLDTASFPSVPAPSGTKIGAAEYPLASSSMGVNLAAAQAAAEGALKAMLFYNSNMVAEYSNPEHLAEALGALELCVVVDVQLTETAQLADYVLPECSYLERSELPEFISGKIPCVTLRNQVLDRIHPNTRTCDEIFAGLAEACGVSRYFPFTIRELAEAQLESVGLSVEAVANTGTVYFPDREFSYGTTPTWSTSSGKIQFTSEACESAGYTASPTWVEPTVMPEGDQLRLIGGTQSVHSRTMTANVADLMEITKQYDLTRVWINADVAEELGIADGDEVAVSNDSCEGTVRAKVTQRINPTALYMPGHYGCTAREQTNAYGVGLRHMDYVPFRIEPGYGGACTQETTVTVKKAGA